jgi:hypothetical protein
MLNVILSIESRGTYIFLKVLSRYHEEQVQSRSKREGEEKSYSRRLVFLMDAQHMPLDYF